MGQEILAALGVDTTGLAICVATIIVGGWIKGYSAFGASMVFVTGLALVLPPVEVIPMTVLFEVATSLHLMPAVRREVDWRSVRLLLIGTAIATPIGVYGLANVPADPARIAVAIAVLIATALLGAGFSLARVPGIAATLVIGLAAGLMNGAFGFVGPVVVIFYLSSPLAIGISRASIITYFLGCGLLAAAVYAFQDLMTGDVLLRLAVFLPIVLAANWMGHLRFTETPPGSFRRFALFLLITLALALIARTIWL